MPASMEETAVDRGCHTTPNRTHTNRKKSSASGKGKRRGKSTGADHAADNKDCGAERRAGWGLAGKVRLFRSPGCAMARETESGFLKAVLDLAAAFGWRRAHFRPAMTKRGWRTAVSGDGKGFPDLILVRERMIAAELKVGRNPLTPEQREWLAAMKAAGIETHEWRPDDWDSSIVPALRRI